MRSELSGCRTVAFVRNPDGSWFCRKRAHIVGPYGPMSTESGKTYRSEESVSGYDVAEWLDNWSGRRAIPVVCCRVA